jgi:hypothetical protein
MHFSLSNKILYVWKQWSYKIFDFNWFMKTNSKVWLLLLLPLSNFRKATILTLIERYKWRLKTLCKINPSSFLNLKIWCEGKVLFSHLLFLNP